MGAANEYLAYELIVADDGSIPAEQLAQFGVAPGDHLRVVESETPRPADALAGSLSAFPDLTWDDFERASELAQHDVSAG